MLQELGATDRDNSVGRLDTERLSDGPEGWIGHAAREGCSRENGQVPCSFRHLSRATRAVQ